MGVHVRSAELHVVLAMSPGEIVLRLRTAPSVHPGPPPWGVTDIVRSRNGNRGQLVSSVVGRKQVRNGVSRRLLPETEVAHVYVVDRKSTRLNSSHLGIS